MKTVWIFLPTGDLFLMEDLGDKFKVSYNEHLKEIFNKDYMRFLYYSQRLGEL